MTASIDFQFVGYRGLKRALNAAAPDMRKAMDAEIKSIIEPIRKRAEIDVPTDAPLSGWARSPLKQRNGNPVPWNPKARKRVKIYIPRTRRNNPNSWLVARRLVQGTAAGAIYTYAGSDGGQTPQGQKFVAAMRAKHGGHMRSIYRAYDEAGGANKVNAQVVKVMGQWARNFQRQLDNVED